MVKNFEKKRINKRNGLLVPPSHFLGLSLFPFSFFFIAVVGVEQEF